MHVENNVYYASHVHEYAVLTVVFEVNPEHTQYYVYCGRPLFFNCARDAMSCPDCEVQ